MTDREHVFELMSAKLDGELDEAGERELAELLASCSEFRELMSVMSGAREALSEEAEPPEELLSGVMDGVRRIEAGRRSRRRRYAGLGAGLAAAAVLALAFVPGRAGSKDGEAVNEAANVPAAYSADVVEPRAVSPGGTGGENTDGQEPAVCIGPEDGLPVMPGPELEPEEPTMPAAPAMPTEPAPEPEDEDLVVVTEYIPGIYVDLKYATEDNFTGQVIYDFTEARLRYGTVKKLMTVEEALEERGMALMIWDACRPVAAQFKLWEVCPDSRYVADPNKGYSSHSRGNTVDLTLVTADGADVEMPTGFDDFTALADRDYSDVSDEAAGNAALLEELMTAGGFKPYFDEWWHYTDTDSYDVVE